MSGTGSAAALERDALAHPASHRRLGSAIEEATGSPIGELPVVELALAGSQLALAGSQKGPL